MRSFFKKLSFRKKILSSYIIFIGISCLLFVIYAGKSMENAREESSRYMHQLGEQISLNTDIIISNMDRIRFIHFVDLDVRPIIRTSNRKKDYKRYFEDVTYMQKVISHMTNMNQYILRAVIVNEYGDIYSNVNTEQREYLDGLRAFTQEQDLSSKVSTAYTGVYESRINLVPYHIVTSVSRMYDIDKETPIGTLYIDLNFDAVSKLFDQTFDNKENPSYFLILDHYKNPIYSSPYTGSDFWDALEAEEKKAVLEILSKEKLPDGQEPVFLKLNGKTCIASVVKNASTGWTVFQYELLSRVYSKGLKNMVGVLLGMGLL